MLLDQVFDEYALVIFQGSEPRLAGRRAGEGQGVLQHARVQIVSASDFLQSPGNAARGVFSGRFDPPEIGVRNADGLPFVPPVIGEGTAVGTPLLPDDLALHRVEDLVRDAVAEVALIQWVGVLRVQMDAAPCVFIGAGLAVTLGTKGEQPTVQFDNHREGGTRETGAAIGLKRLVSIAKQVGDKHRKRCAIDRIGLPPDCVTHDFGFPNRCRIAQDDEVARRVLERVQADVLVPRVAWTEAENQPAEEHIDPEALRRHLFRRAYIERRAYPSYQPGLRAHHGGAPAGRVDSCRRQPAPHPTVRVPARTADLVGRRYIGIQVSRVVADIDREGFGEFHLWRQRHLDCHKCPIAQIPNGHGPILAGLVHSQRRRFGKRPGRHRNRDPVLNAQQCLWLVRRLNLHGYDGRASLA